jgi:hypothetical protein
MVIRIPTTASATRRSIVVATAVAMLGVSPTAAAHAAPPTVTGDPGVVLAWNAVAFRTIAVEGLKPAQVTELYLGLVSTAVYNAVVTIDGHGQPTLRQPSPPGPASSDVAAATAAHDVLVHFFSGSADRLDADYDAWLATVPESAGRTGGLQVGREAADALIASRLGDGRDASPSTLPPPATPYPAPWVETGSGPFSAPWLGFVRPVLIDSPTRFRVDGPDPLTSSAYAADFEEVRTMGAATGSNRSPAQSDLALFFSDNPVRQYQDAMRDRAQRHRMDILQSARMFAAANAAGADALIVCWRAKYDYNSWRPVTAIRQAGTDGNPATTADPAWAPFRTTPPYPEYASGHACVSEATARALQDLFGPGEVDMTIRSAAAGVVDTERTYTDERRWLDDVTNARIWLGFHFRDAMDDGRQIGRRVADAVVRNWF